MPVYDFQCNKCEQVYEELAPYDPTDKYKKVKCPHCGSKSKTKLMSCCSFNFTNPIGTDRWHSEDNGHDYRLKHNLPRVLKEREMAERMSHMGATPYGTMDDFNMGEGVHDPETRKGLS